tara:strand:- start:5280 stop:5894 length:615 start_codon:yes stop_codon:yes gene_type:complete
MDSKQKNKFKDSLSDLLSDLPDEVPGLETQPKLLKVQSSVVPQSSQLRKAKNKAKSVMNSLLKFYLSEEIIEEHEYIQAKSSIDEYALSMLIRQMQNSEIAITILMDTINEGDVSPRMFEVLSDLQRTLLDIIKSQTMYMVAIEENAKKIARDIDVYGDSSSSSSSKNKKGGVKSRGTKDLMKALQQTIEEEEIEDVDYDTNEE